MTSGGSPRDAGALPSPASPDRHSTHDPGSAAITVESITKRYDDRAAVEDLSFSVAPGSVFALLGTNGAGKTTTVEILEGYRRPDEGGVSVLGLDPAADARVLRPRIGLMLQAGGIYNGARVREVVELFCSFYPSARDPDDLIGLVGLESSQRTIYRRLSGGQQRRLALAVALAGEPEVLFLDEPTAGMDPMARQVTYRIVRDLKSRGVTILLTTHLLDEAEALADTVAIIDRGRLLALGTPTELMTGRSSMTFGAPAGIDLSGLPPELGHVTEVRPGEFFTDVEPTPQHLADLAAWAAHRNVLLPWVRAGARSLEEVFLDLVDEADPDAAPESSAAGGST